jgi:hypothetical protein
LWYSPPSKWTTSSVLLSPFRFHLPPHRLATRHLRLSERLPERLLPVLHHLLAQKVLLPGHQPAGLSPVQANLRQQPHPTHPQISPGQPQPALPPLQQWLPRSSPLLRHRLSHQGLSLQKYPLPELVRTCRGCKNEILARDYDTHINSCPKYTIECGFCGGSMSKFKYLEEHIHYDGEGVKVKRSYNCYENEISALGNKVTGMG